MLGFTTTRKINFLQLFSLKLYLRTSKVSFFMIFQKKSIYLFLTQISSTSLKPFVYPQIETEFVFLPKQGQIFKNLQDNLAFLYFYPIYLYIFYANLAKIRLVVQTPEPWFVICGWWRGGPFCRKHPGYPLKCLSKILVGMENPAGLTTRGSRPGRSSKCHNWDVGQLLSHPPTFFVIMTSIYPGSLQ